MSNPKVRAFCVAVLAVLTLLPTLPLKMAAPANFGAHGLSTGFGRGRLDMQGIVSEGTGTIVLPSEPLTLTVRLSGTGSVQVSGSSASQTFVATEIPTSLRLDLPEGGEVRIESASRVRLYEIVLERKERSLKEIALLVLAGVVAVLLTSRGATMSIAALLLLPVAFLAITAGSLSATFARMAVVQLAPLALAILLFTPLILALRAASFVAMRDVSRLTAVAFLTSLALGGAQLLLFEQPLPVGDPGAYLEMGGKFADAMARVGSPLGLGPILADLQPYLALPATGLLYGLLTLTGGLGWIYLVQAITTAIAVTALVSICESEMGSRVARLALLIALIHPTFAVLPGLVQPEPFILAAWTTAALVALHSLRRGAEARAFLAAGLLFGAGLALHPQGLSFLLLALVLCLLPWLGTITKKPSVLAAAMIGVFAVLLPIAAAEHFSKPLAHVLDKQYGFFAYTSPHPLGFWLYTDSNGWQGPLRIDDTTYQKELFAMKGEAAVSSTFADVAAFVLRHPSVSIETLLTNLHRLWNQPDNPFAASFVLPYGLQIPLHRGLIVLFVLALPVWFKGRLALLALPFVMLSMTYPAYHVFNKYATPALPFTIIGAAFTLDLLVRERARVEGLIVGLFVAAAGALLPATLFARLGMDGDAFILVVRAGLWIGLAMALAKAIRFWGGDGGSRLLSGAVGFTILLASSFAASRTDTARGAWSTRLDAPFEVSCRVPDGGVRADAAIPAWLFIDVQSADATPPKLEVNGQMLAAVEPTMPIFGLATTRGHRDPVAFRQLWRARIGEDLLAAGDLKIRVSGGAQSRIFGDIRSGNEGPRLSLGQWPYLSVYRLMHEGEYRLPTKNVAPPQACAAFGFAGRPGISLVRILPGDESRIGLASTKPPAWVF